jgi:hypothetical protein
MTEKIIGRVDDACAFFLNGLHRLLYFHQLA